MIMNNNPNGYVYFLKDKKFIQWQLVPDASLNAYWNQFIKDNPDSVVEMEYAVDYLQTIGLNNQILSEEEYAQLFRKIESSLRDREKKKQILRFSLYAAAACISIVLGVSLFSHLFKATGTPDNELIIGQLLKNEDIQFITNNETLLFQNDVDVTLNEEGTAEINQGDKESSTIEIGRNEFTSLVVPFGKRSTLTLADGSRVWLNSGSVLEFPSQFNGKKREIRLVSGEMYIEVAPDSRKPFHVRTDHFNVKVYGTKFNVSAYSPSVHSVVLVEGCVSIRSAEQSELILKPSEQAISTGEGGTIKTQFVNCEEFTSWKDGFFIFSQTPIEEVLRQIGRYYNIRFDFAPDISLKERSCTGKIYLSDKLENVMATITLLSNTEYIIENDQIQIFNKRS